MKSALIKAEKNSYIPIEHIFNKTTFYQNSIRLTATLICDDAVSFVEDLRTVRTQFVGLYSYTAQKISIAPALSANYTMFNNNINLQTQANSTFNSLGGVVYPTGLVSQSNPYKAASTYNTLPTEDASSLDLFTTDVFSNGSFYSLYFSTTLLFEQAADLNLLKNNVLLIRKMSS